PRSSKTSRLPSSSSPTSPTTWGTKGTSGSPLGGPWRSRMDEAVRLGLIGCAGGPHTLRGLGSMTRSSSALEARDAYAEPNVPTPETVSCYHALLRAYHAADDALDRVR